MVLVAVSCVGGLPPDGASRALGDEGSLSSTGSVSSTSAVSVPRLGAPDAYGNRELLDRRTATSRTMLTRRHTLRADIFASPVNYRDGSGAWQPIDPGLVPSPSGEGFEVKASAVQVHLPSSLSGEVRVSTGSASIGFALQGAGGRAVIAGARANYAHALPGVDVSYLSTGSLLKETATLTDADAANSLTWSLSTSGVTATASAAGGVDFWAGTHRVLAFTPPTVVDAAGTGGPVSLRLGQDGKAVTLTVDPGWLDAPDRAFPVVIDPGVILDTAADGVDCTIASGSSAGTSSCAAGLLPVGFDGSHVQRALIRWDVSSAVPYDAIVESASINLTSEDAASGGTVFDLHRATRAWTTAATWNTYDGVHTWTTAGGDYIATPVNSDTSTSSGSHVFYPGGYIGGGTGITALATGWVAGFSANDGVLLKKRSETAVNTVHFDSFQTTSWGPPELSIEYLPNLGQRPFYRLDEHTLTDRSSAAVNVANGNLTIRGDDIAIPGAGLNLSLERVYNSLAGQYGTGYTNLFGGSGWSGTTDDTTLMDENSDGSVNLAGPGGWVVPFTHNADGTYRTPAGIDATLTGSYGTTFHYTLTFNKTGEKLTFDDPTDSGFATLTSDSDRNGNTVSYSYDAARRLLSLTDTQGRRLTVTGRSTGNYAATGFSDPTGRTWTYGYDATGNLTSYTDPAGKVTNYGYDAAENLTKITDAVGRVTRFGYDTSRRVTSITYVTDTSTGTGPTTTFAYHPGSVNAFLAGYTVETDANGHTTTYYYDYLDRVTKTVDPLGHARQAAYTVDNNVSSVTDALSAVYSLSYDAKNNLTKVQAPTTGSGTSGFARTFAYAATAQPYQPSSMTDAQGNTTSYGYDTTGNLQTVTTALASGRTSTNSYQGTGGSCGGKPGELCTVTDANGHVTSYSYDTAGNLTKVTPPSPLGATTRVPDALGRTATVTDGKGQKTTYTYDQLDRVTQAMFSGATTCTPSAGTCVTYAYDADGNLTQRVDVTGTTTFSYDALNRPTAKATPQGTTSMTYDAVGNALTYTDPTGTTTYRYDPANRLISLAEPGGSCTTSPATKCTTFGYDDNDRRTAVTYPSGVNTAIGYDSAGRETKVSATRPAGAVFVSRTYNYDAASGADTALRQTVTDQAGAVTTYSYDPLNRLTKAVTGTTTLAYAYDPVGNRLSRPEGSHGYNAADELTDTGYGYDPDGNQTAAPGQTLAYNGLHQTSSITAGSTTVAMSYADIDGTERTKAGGTTFLNGLLGLTSQTAGTTTVAFTRDPNGNLISMRVGGASYYYVLDALGSVLSLTDGAGNDAATYAYDPYGQTTSATGAQATINPYRFASGYYDTSTGLVKFGTRYDNPTLGRWTQRDPVPGTIENPNTVNRYAYVGCNPVNAVDPTGYCSLLDVVEYGGSAFVGALGAFAGFLAGGPLGALGVVGGLTTVGLGGFGLGACS